MKTLRTALSKRRGEKKEKEKSHVFVFSSKLPSLTFLSVGAQKFDSLPIVFFSFSSSIAEWISHRYQSWLFEILIQKRRDKCDVPF